MWLSWGFDNIRIGKDVERNVNNEGLINLIHTLVFPSSRLPNSFVEFPIVNLKQNSKTVIFLFKIGGSIVQKSYFVLYNE